jgi:predicted nucleic acid-binding protein
MTWLSNLLVEDKLMNTIRSRIVRGVKDEKIITFMIISFLLTDKRKIISEEDIDKKIKEFYNQVGG